MITIRHIIILILIGAVLYHAGAQEMDCEVRVQGDWNSISTDPEDRVTIKELTDDLMSRYCTYAQFLPAPWNTDHSERFMNLFEYNAVIVDDIKTRNLIRPLEYEEVVYEYLRERGMPFELEEAVLYDHQLIEENKYELTLQVNKINQFYVNEEDKVALVPTQIKGLKYFKILVDTEQYFAKITSIRDVVEIRSRSNQSSVGKAGYDHLTLTLPVGLINGTSQPSPQINDLVPSYSESDLDRFDIGVNINYEGFISSLPRLRYMVGLGFGNASISSSLEAYNNLWLQIQSGFLDDVRVTYLVNPQEPLQSPFEQTSEIEDLDIFIEQFEGTEDITINYFEVPLGVKYSVIQKLGWSFNIDLRFSLRWAISSKSSYTSAQLDFIKFPDKLSEAISRQDFLSLSTERLQSYRETAPIASSESDIDIKGTEAIVAPGISFNFHPSITYGFEIGVSPLFGISSWEGNMSSDQAFLVNNTLSAPGGGQLDIKDSFSFDHHRDLSFSGLRFFIGFYKRIYRQ